MELFTHNNLQILNTYWTKASPLSKISMLSRAILGDGEATISCVYFQLPQEDQENVFLNLEVATKTFNGEYTG